MMNNGNLITIGRVLDGRYRVTKVLSTDGGFGVTFIAEDTKRPGNPICVVKQLKPRFNSTSLLEIAKDKFNKEAKTLETLGEHDRIPR